MGLRIFTVYCTNKREKIGSLSARDEKQAEKMAKKFFGTTATVQNPNNDKA